ncbi:unnamed protein product [Cylindrotheca closterium]|uniref:Uncharacterized protein n=1 Tax=Cylindrotheca closterium TaxID=2856 RepID=A0AAD2G0V5_9STRA|nr:unnamed protein product [Cylindrotheca closterium]
MVVDWLLHQWAPTLQLKPRVRIACDGFSALLNTFSDNRVTPQQAQFDLVSSLREALARSKALWEPSHVYGHLHHATSFSSLSWWSKRNVEVDNWAVAYCHQLEASNQLIAPNARFFTELAAVYIGDVKQSRLDPDYIQELVARETHSHPRGGVENRLDQSGLGHAISPSGRSTLDHKAHGGYVRCWQV